jgi:AcrR family transcriptional regulator
MDGESGGEAPGRRGRPRDERLDQAIIAAATRLLLDVGYAAFSVDLVTSHTGVAKTTIYRRWPTKAHLVVAVIGQLQRQVANPDTGDLRRDLLDLTRGLAEMVCQPGIRELAAELIAASARDADLWHAIRRLWGERREATLEVLRRAGWPDPELAVDQLAGPIYYRLLITGDPVEETYATRLVDAVIGRHDADQHRTRTTHTEESERE